MVAAHNAKVKPVIDYSKPTSAKHRAEVGKWLQETVEQLPHPQSPCPSLCKSATEGASLVNVATGRPCFDVAQSKDESKLNKTERRYLATLRANPNVKWIGIQSLTFKLGDDLRFTPDFCYLLDGKLICVDTKGGFIREDSAIKIKVAARMFPWAEFVVEQWSGGVWLSKKITG